MHPELEFFLEQALDSMEPVLPAVGRVVVEPDYDVNPAAEDADALARELLSRQTPDPAKLASSEGDPVTIPSASPMLRKYLRSITMHQDSAEGAWIEVAPPGNWI